MNAIRLSQQFRSLLIVTIMVVTLAVTTAVAVNVGTETNESANSGNSSLYLAGPVTDDGGGG